VSAARVALVGKEVSDEQAAGDVAPDPPATKPFKGLKGAAAARRTAKARKGFPNAAVASGGPQMSRRVPRTVKERLA